MTMTQAEKRAEFDAGRRGISTERPRLLGSREEMRKLAKERAGAYAKMVAYARKDLAEEGYEMQAKIFGLAIAYVVEGNKKEGRAAVDLVLKHHIDQPIRVGHQTFAHDMARCAIAYDLCHDLWTDAERERFRKYAHATIEGNVESEGSTFHNGWYGYKHWGYGMAGYALMHDDPEAGTILKNLERDYLELAAPALRMAGNGGGWAEGYYIHYWLYEWMFFCEVARKVEGLDYYAAAPEFFEKRAVAAMFEYFPPVVPPTEVKAEHGNPGVKATESSRKLLPMGDGGGKFVKHERDKTLATMWILNGLHREDAAHRAVAMFAEGTPRVAVPADLYMEFLWKDAGVKGAGLEGFKLSHVSPGAGFVYARSSWKEDATHFFFKCGARFTAHQHLDNGHFLIFKHDELLGDGGHYAGWTNPHVVDYYIRTIAHNTLLIEDPGEKFEGVRTSLADNDGGQKFHGEKDGVHHNYGVSTVSEWEKNREVMDIGTLTAYVDRGNYLYVAGDFTKSYSGHKAKGVTRQIVFLRPGTFVIFDRVEATDAGFKKKFVLQPMSVPEKRGGQWVVTQGKGRLFIQTLLPEKAAVELFHGETLYTYGGKKHPPEYEFNRAPDCRMEISAAAGVAPAALEYFLHVLTATEAGVESVAAGSAKREGGEVVVKVGEATVRFAIEKMGGTIEIGGKKEELRSGGVS